MGAHWGSFLPPISPLGISYHCTVLWSWRAWNCLTHPMTALKTAPLNHSPITVCWLNICPSCSKISSELDGEKSSLCDSHHCLGQGLGPQWWLMKPMLPPRFLCVVAIEGHAWWLGPLASLPKESSLELRLHVVHPWCHLGAQTTVLLPFLYLTSEPFCYLWLFKCAEYYI